MTITRNRVKPSQLSKALTAVLMLSTSAAFAQDQGTPVDETVDSAQSRATTLDKVTVTGSLIPQTQIETFTPVTVITAEDIQSRGFTSVADVLQQSSFATGGVQGSQSSASFTQGAETLSLFGLNPGYVKYLIDGRPMANYPALYNGSDTFNNISGVPVDLVERIEILPGGQSSLYGSDAIAGVVNIILKKKMEGTTFGIRGGWYSDGGGASTRASFATGFSSEDERFNMLIGVQAEERDPIWASARAMTRQFYTNSALPNSAPLASRDYLTVGYYGSYYFTDPANCSNITSQFDGTLQLQQRPGFGDEFYCGSQYTPGYRTLRNGRKGAQLYTHATFAANDNLELYGDFLYNDEKVSYHVGSNYTWWGTSGEWGYFYDPRFDDIVNLQRAFSPEDMGAGGFRNTMSTDKSKSWVATLGARGGFGQSDWTYDASLSHTRYDLDEVSWVRFNDAINQYFVDHVLGPQNGTDPWGFGYPVFEPNYAAFYQTMTPEDFWGFSGFANSKSRTTDTLLRGQVTNGALFSLPGGDAGIAIAAEYAQEDWRYTPDPGFLNGDIWGQTAVAGGGERDRYAVTGELRLPVLEPLTISLSGRYDKFTPSGAETVDKPTYSIGIEYRPVESLLFRGKYGTAFKAPTLADQFQGTSGYYSFVTDFYNCFQLGFDPGNVQNCPAAHSNRQFFGETEGTIDLEPLTAKVWSYGVVWAPTAKFSLSADYYHWDIEDEVGSQSPDGLALTEMRCRTGQPGYDITSPTCVAALAQITRGSNGRITYIFTPKINEAREVLDAISLNTNYRVDINDSNQLLLRGSFTSNLKHDYWQYEGDPGIDLLTSPGWSSDPKRKANASVTWRTSSWNSTLYANWMSGTPNNRARALDSYNDPNLGLAGMLPSHTTYNFSVSYQPLEDLELSFLVNNLTNKMPPEDRTYAGTSGSPYNGAQYSAYGRAFYLEMRYTFGN